jgi:hypothetical protein
MGGLMEVIMSAGDDKDKDEYDPNKDPGWDEPRDPYWDGPEGYQADWAALAEMAAAEAQEADEAVDMSDDQIWT